MALEFLDDVDDDFRGRGMTTLFPLNVFLFSFFCFLQIFFFNSEKRKKKKKERKKENGVVSVILMAAHNWGLIESYINKN